MSARLRKTADPFVVAAPTGARIRTRLRLSPADEQVLTRVGSHLGRLAGEDLAARCALGTGAAHGKVVKHAGRGVRKQALTGASSSRWAGTLTRTSADQWQRAWNNLWDERASLRAAIATITRRCAAPVGGKAGKTRGYATVGQRWAKQQRCQQLQARLADVERCLTQGRVSVVRGGARLARNRHHLEAGGLTEAQWRDRWESARLFISADGEADKAWGNETIRVHPEHGWVQVRLPTPLADRSNTPGRAATYRLDATATFAHRADEWAAQAASGAVAYTIWRDADKGRWYLDASWTAPRTHPQRDLSALQSLRTVGVDLNDDHLACWVIAPDGNPVGPAHTIPLELEGDTARRDGQLRAAISALLDYAHRHGCASVTIENLNFADARATGRETMGAGRRGKRFRRTVAGIPTGKFRDRLAGMAANAAVAVIAVDPAYTSKWGASHWQDHLDRTRRRSRAAKVTRHQAAAVVIARRGLGQRARRRTEKTDAHQRMRAGEPSSRPNATPRSARNPDPREGDPHQQPLGNTDPPDHDSQPGNQATQHRSGPPTGQDSLLPSA